MNFSPKILLVITTTLCFFFSSAKAMDGGKTRDPSDQDHSSVARSVPASSAASTRDPATLSLEERVAAIREALAAAVRVRSGEIVAARRAYDQALAIEGIGDVSATTPSSTSSSLVLINSQGAPVPVDCSMGEFLPALAFRSLIQRMERWVPLLRNIYVPELIARQLARRINPEFIVTLTRLPVDMSPLILSYLYRRGGIGEDFYDIRMDIQHPVCPSEFFFFPSSVPDCLKPPAIEEFCLAESARFNSSRGMFEFALWLLNREAPSEDIRYRMDKRALRFLKHVAGNPQGEAYREALHHLGYRSDDLFVRLCRSKREVLLYAVLANKFRKRYLKTLSEPSLPRLCRRMIVPLRALHSAVPHLRRARELRNAVPDSHFPTVAEAFHTGMQAFLTLAEISTAPVASTTGVITLSAPLMSASSSSSAGVSKSSQH